MIKYIYIIILTSVILASCSDSLEESPVTFFDEATIYSTEEGVESAINGMYASFSAPQYYGSAWHNFMMPVSGLFYSSQLANRDATGLNTTSSNPNLDQIWAQQFRTINAANVMIANLQDNDNTLANRNTALGHAYFIRGKTYLDLVRMFGGVPLRTMPASIDQIHVSRATKQEVIDLVESDLSLAKSLMPSVGETTVARPTNLAANVYLAKLYMYLAGTEGDADMWINAKDELLEVINSGNYQLLPTYAEVFEFGNENTQESIFELNYGHTGGIRNADLVRLYTPSNSTFAPSNTTTFGRIRPNKEVFDQHISTHSDDPRIDGTFIYNSYEKSNGGNQRIYPDNANGNQGFPLIRKWLDPTYNGTTTNRNYILLRYADVLLMMAEVENEINGPENAYQYVNQVLARARDIDGDGVSDSSTPVDFADMTEESFRQAIMLERRFELLSEGEDWFDQRRRGYDFLLENVILPHNNNPTFDEGKEFMYPDDQKNLLLPIPLSELSGNQMIGVEDQNPGY